MVSTRCSICNHEEKTELEALGVEALQGLRSWRSAGIDGGLSHANSLRHHMEQHYVHSAVERAKREASGELAVFLKDALDELTKAMVTAPTETKPLYAMMIHNLSALEQTKPSQNSLIAAAKAIHEITGMKMQQRLLLNYAEAFTPAIDARPKPLEIEEAEVVDVPDVRDGFRPDKD